jgi:hypothetical protein
MMIGWRVIRPVFAASLAVAALLVQAVVAEETHPRSDLWPVTGVPAAPSPDPDFLANLAKDLRLSLLPSAGELSLRMPLAPGDWTLGGLRPYAVLSPRVWRPAMEGLTGLAVPDRESAPDLSHGLGIGPGVTWHLSDRLDLFGQYLFRATPSTIGPAASPILQPDVESSGVKGGFSIHF